MSSSNPVYSQPLRAIGQALEVLRIESFDLESEGDYYIVRVKSNKPSSEADYRQKSFQRGLVEQVWETVPPELEQALASLPDPSPEPVPPLRYSPADIDRLETDGRSRRGNTNTSPDFHTISRVLRVIGDKLNRSNARGFAISCSNQSVSIKYQTKASDQKNETFSVNALYNQADRMGQRRSRG
jgi:hypothetical protein